MDQTTQDRIDAAVFRRLLDHLDMRKDAQNIDLMGLAGFCRNCLSDWYMEAAEEAGTEVSKDESRERIYGMAYADYKAKFQASATDEQLEKMGASVTLNKKLKADRT